MFSGGSDGERKLRRPAVASAVGEARRSGGQRSAEGVGWTKGIRHLGLSVREGKIKGEIRI